MGFMFTRKGRGVRRSPGQMNGWETKYAAHLDEQMKAGKIFGYTFDAVKLRLADKTFYTPDFMVQQNDDTIEIHEVKGFWEDDARVKIKVAAKLFPFRFIAVTKKKGDWIYEEI